MRRQRCTSRVSCSHLWQPRSKEHRSHLQIALPSCNRLRYSEGHPTPQPTLHNATPLIPDRAPLLSLHPSSLSSSSSHLMNKFPVVTCDATHIIRSRGGRIAGRTDHCDEQDDEIKEIPAVHPPEHGRIKGGAGEREGHQSYKLFGRRHRRESTENWGPGSGRRCNVSGKWHHVSIRRLCM